MGGVDHEAIVAGAGPAGLAAGLVLARAGIDTLVCDRQRLPIDKACGDGILPAGVRALSALGVLDAVPPDQRFWFRGIRYVSPSGRSAAVDFREGPGIGMSRSTLSRALGESARRQPNLTLIEGQSLKPRERHADAVVVNVGGRLLRTRLLLGADGIYSQVRRWSGLEIGSGPLQRWGCRFDVEIEPWSSYVEVYICGGAEAYATPCTQRHVSLALLWDEARLGLLKKHDRIGKALLERLPMLRQRKIAQALDERRPRSAGPLQRRAHGRTADGVILIGDAGGYLDAATGEGISLALAQAIVLTATVVPALTKAREQRRSVQKVELAAYERAVAAGFSRYARYTRTAVAAASHRWLSEPLLSLFSASPRIFEKVVSAGISAAANIR